MKYTNLMVLAVACLLGFTAHAQGKLPTKRISFEKAVEQAQDLKHCKKKDRFPIAEVELRDEKYNWLDFSDPPPALKSKQTVFLIVSAKDAPEGGMGGPLDRIPSKAELNALKGKPVCVLPE